MPEHERYDGDPPEHVSEEPPREVIHEREVRERPLYHEERVERPAYYEEPAEPPAVHDSGPSWTSYALIEYGFILAIVVVVLYFIAQFVLPLLP